MANKLSRYHRLVAEHNAEMLRQNVSFKIMPAELVAKVERKATLERQLSDLRAARALLDDDVRLAFERLQDANASVNAAVARVVSGEIERQVDEISTLDAKIAALKSKLSGCAMLQVGALLTLSAKAKGMLRDAPIRPATAAWVKFAERLKEGGDVEAKLDE